jgi:hypothetical protein
VLQGAGDVRPPFFVLGIKRLFVYGREREEEAIVDVARASDQIDALIERRAGEGGRANAEEVLWKASVRKHHAKLGRQRRTECFAHYSCLSASLRRSAEEYDRRAEALPEEPCGGEGYR